MKHPALGRLFAVGSALSLVLAFFSLRAVAPAQGFTAGGAAITTQVITSQAQSGQSSVLALDGSYNNCSVVASDQGGLASITVFGNGQQGQHGPAGPGIANPNFGTAGVVAVTAVLSVTSGNVANLPVGFYFTWTGNTGTLYAYATCTSAIAKRMAAPTPPPTPTPTPGNTQPIFTSTGTQSVATVGINTYSQIGTTQTVTMPPSSGPTGKWLLTLTMQASVSGTTAQPVYLCATALGAGWTVLDFLPSASAPATCVTLTGMTGTVVTGGPVFATAGASGNNANGASQIVLAHLSFDSLSGTFSANCYAASASPGGFTVLGYCCVEAIPV